MANCCVNTCDAGAAFDAALYATLVRPPTLEAGDTLVATSSGGSVRVREVVPAVGFILVSFFV